MAIRKQINKSNGYSSRSFFTFPKNGTIPASMTVSTPSTTATVCWSPTLKKYFYGGIAQYRVFSRAPDENFSSSLYTSNSGCLGIHWSKTLNMLVYMSNAKIVTSVDGINWIERTLPASYAPDSISTFVDASSYLLVFGKEDSTGYMYKTTDGINWTRSASGTGSSTSVVAGAIGDTVGYSNNNGTTASVYYTTNGTTYSTANNSGTYQFWPPTPIRPVFCRAGANDVYQSIDGITYTDTGMDADNYSGNHFGGQYSAYFGSIMKGYYSGNDYIGEYLSIGVSSPAFVGSRSGYGDYPDEVFVSIEGEYATYTNRTKAHRVGKWLDIGEHEVWLIGGGAPNANTSVGGTAGCMVIHRLTVTEKWRYCVYVYLGAAAIVDTLTGEFLAYASMLTSTSTSAQVNTAGFGTEVYYGLGAKGAAGAACGPSNGLPAFLGISGNGGATVPCGSFTSATTTATTPPDWWCFWDFAGNPAGTGYPGTAGSGSSPVNGIMAAASASGITASFGGGGCNISTALATVGGEPLAIIYSR